jgi:hypothetical protein
VHLLLAGAADPASVGRAQRQESWPRRHLPVHPPGHRPRPTPARCAPEHQLNRKPPRYLAAGGRVLPECGRDRDALTVRPPEVTEGGLYCAGQGGAGGAQPARPRTGRPRTSPGTGWTTARRRVPDEISRAGRSRKGTGLANRGLRRGPRARPSRLPPVQAVLPGRGRQPGLPASAQASAAGALGRAFHNVRGEACGCLLEGQAASRWDQG